MIRQDPMLASLHIKDFAIIDELEVKFTDGFNVMTGETGAGKTIIVEALKLVLGDRAEKDLIRAGKESASVTAVFENASMTDGVSRELEGLGIEGGELIIHRVIKAEGSGKITLNGIPVTAGQLQRIAEGLVDVSSQHEHQLLIDPVRHASILDSFGSFEEKSHFYREAHRRYSAALTELKQLEEDEKGAKERFEFLKYQRDELASANLKAGEDAELEALRGRMKHSVLLEEKSRTAEGLLYRNAGSALEAVDNALSLILQCAEFDAKASEWKEALTRARGDIEETARALSNYADTLGSDPAELERIEERLHVIRGLVKKHGGSIEACLKRKDALTSDLEKIENYDEVLAQKRAEVAELANARRKIAEAWSKLRQKAAVSMGKVAAAELSHLGMAKVKFEAGVTARLEGDWDESGPDHVEFMFSPNPGEPLMSLIKIASGGELSRVMLALKGVLADRSNLAGTSVFDEVDAGIGGGVADAVGKKLREVARSRQVICITHLPQVAVHGESHLKIEKQVIGGRTVTRLWALREKGRVTEVARMLGGERLAKTAVAHAEEMLKSAR